MKKRHFSGWALFWGILAIFCFGRLGFELLGVYRDTTRPAQLALPLAWLIISVGSCAWQLNKDERR